MAKVAHIGAGLVGKAMALDLAKQHNVFLTDFNNKALKEVQSLNQNIVTSCFDLNDTDQLTEFISKSDLVLVAVPGNLGFETIQKIIKCKKNIVDISFSTLYLEKIGVVNIQYPGLLCMDYLMDLIEVL